MNGNVWCTNGGLAARTAAKEARREAHAVHAHDKLAFSRRRPLPARSYSPHRTS